ncbi:MAG: protein kinase, partial [Chloroflexota bacterium]|nr:protein kinase [Chloroflexota bacterium]
MNCRSCGKTNPAESSFCNGCGSRLYAGCPNCGQENPAASAFCSGCSASLDATAAPEKPATARQPAPLPASFAGGRYAVRSFLGEGGTKRVYLAHDTKLDRDVAFALIKTEGLDADGRVRVRREAQAMGKLSDHPHIVTVYDTGDEDGADGQSQPYIVSQYMPGGSVDALLAAAEHHRLPIEQAVRIADHLCDALAYAHALGVVHRDLKPGNVWLAHDGTAKLLDLGLAVSLDRSRLTMEGMMVGTVAYMAPEQAMGGTPDARSDLYALGAMLYEIVAGRPPFVGDDVVAVISQHLNTAPIAPSWHNPELPRALETLILRLLEKDPAQRPASAGEVRQALGAIDLSKPPSIQASAITPAQAASKDPIYRPTFVGRETESGQLHALFDNALSGQGALVMVVGEPGIGKTSLCEQLATYAALRGGLALRGNCYEEGSLSLPYLPFVEALRSYVLAREPEGLRSELGANAPRVARIISEVRDRIEVELSPPGDPEEERYRLLEAVTAFLRSAAAVQPLLIVLEDLHDADRGTLDLLTHIARNLQGARLLIVGTYRDIEV